MNHRRQILLALALVVGLALPSALLVSRWNVTARAQDPPPDIQAGGVETGGLYPDLGQGKAQSESTLLLQVTQLATSPALPNAMLASLADSQIPIYSKDGGVHWEEVGTAPWVGSGTTLPLRVAIAPRIDPYPLRLIVAVPGDDPSKVGIYRTGDDGQTWAYFPIPIDSRCNQPLYFESLVVSPTDPNRLYLAAYCIEYWFYDVYGSVYTSADAGISWQRIKGGDGVGNWRQPVPSPIVDGRVYVRGPNGTWHQSDDGGQSWVQKDFPIYTLALDAQNPVRLYGVGHNSWGDPIGKRSIDGGSTWSDWDEQLHLDRYYDPQLLAHPTLGNMLFMRDNSSGLFHSTDGGDHWIQLSPWHGQWLGPDYGNPGRLLWARNDGLWASSNYEDSWTKLTDSYHQDFLPWRNISTPDSIIGTTIHALLPVSSTNAWAVGENGTILNWMGNKWFPISSPIETTLYSIGFASPDDGWAVGDDAILRWDGNVWTKVFTPSQSLRGVDVVSADDAWAVGDEGTILHWDGVEWTPPISSAATSTMTLTSVDMVSATDGWAVGAGQVEPEYPEMDHYAPVILRWNGIGWTEVDVVVPGYSAFLTSVDMVSEVDGWAVGVRPWSSGLILRWDGTGWQEVIPPASDLWYGSVSMASPDEGWISESGASLLYWDGDAWTRRDIPESTQSHINIFSPGLPVAALSSGGVWVAREGGVALHLPPPPPPAPLLDKEAAPLNGLRGGDILTYTLVLSCPRASAQLWDPLPPHAEYVTDSLRSTFYPQPVYSPTAHAVIWEGTLPAYSVQTISFQVTPIAGAPGTLAPPIVNTATLSDLVYDRNASATVIVNGKHVYLPLLTLQWP